MASHYWLKLYHEILHDPKMGRLSDRLWRRCIEMFLLAGDYDCEGGLPSIQDMAWALRADPLELTQELVELSKAGILTTDDGCWQVTNWVERQSAVTGAERMRRLRDRKQKRQYYSNESVTDSDEPVTNRNADIDIEQDTDTEEIQNQTTSDTECASAHDGVDPVSRKALESLGIQGQNLWEMLKYPRDAILAWCEYATESESVTRPPGFVISKLREGADPPKQSAEGRWYTRDEYEKHIKGGK